MILNQRGSVNSHVKRQDIRYPYTNIPGNICSISEIFLTIFHTASRFLIQTDMDLK